MNRKELINAQDAAKLLKISYNRVRNLSDVSNDGFNHCFPKRIKIGRFIFFEKSKILAWREKLKNKDLATKTQREIDEYAKYQKMYSFDEKLKKYKVFKLRNKKGH